MAVKLSALHAGLLVTASSNKQRKICGVTSQKFAGMCLHCAQRIDLPACGHVASFVLKFPVFLTSWRLVSVLVRSEVFTLPVTSQIVLWTSFLFGNQLPRWHAMLMFAQYIPVCIINMAVTTRRPECMDTTRTHTECPRRKGQYSGRS
jgi:hypothetical protein